ncbi:MAG: hypothetical protein WBQ18_15740 [Solirubrobacteraceae bacterium]
MARLPASEVANARNAPVEPTIIWRAADGRVIKTITVPSPAAVAALCRRHPTECAAMASAFSSGGSSSASSSGGLSRGSSVTTAPR